MEKSAVPKTTIKMKCPECLNVMICDIQNNGCVSGFCSVCGSKIFTREPSPREKLIRIVRSKKIE